MSWKLGMVALGLRRVEQPSFDEAGQLVRKHKRKKAYTVSEKVLAANRANAQRARAVRAGKPAVLSPAQRDYIAKRQERAARTRALEELSMNPKKKGENNSQWGSYWITDGKVSLKWRDGKGPLPEGFARGRAA